MLEAAVELRGFGQNGDCRHTSLGVGGYATFEIGVAKAAECRRAALELGDEIESIPQNQRWWLKCCKHSRAQRREWLACARFFQAQSACCSHAI
jgi:hypothetical protein